jgi:DNA helicase-2/ATP-dependent DNA helicase PcrA
MEKTRKSIFSEDLLNNEQKNAAEAPIVPLLIVAGAGTGKTKTLINRIFYLIENGIEPSRICAITFTNKAAKEMANRVYKKIGGRDIPYIGTFHSLGAKILREECKEFDRKPNFTIFDDHDSFNLIKKAAKSISPKDEEKDVEKKGKKSSVFFAEGISKIKNLDINFDSVELSENKDENEIAKKIFNKYELALAENNAFDFDDLIQKTVEILKSNKKILEKYQNKFDALLIDEYQDINPKQYEFIKLLSDKHKNITAVGDDEQTIYSWRYADIGIFLNFQKQWDNSKVFFLEQNYRSTSNIINAAHNVVKNNRIRSPKILWTKNPAGSKINIFEAWGENEEAEWIARQIKVLLRDPETENKTIAILYRTNAQSRAIEQALIKNNINYKIFGGLKFYERKEVKDIVSALRYASNPKDVPSRERLEKIISKKKFLEFKDSIENNKDLSPQKIISIFIETFDYLDYLKENFINSTEREGNIVELISFVSTFENLNDLLEKISLLQATDEESEKNKDNKIKNVSCMTIHLAKGLEFDSVFIAGVSEGTLPHNKSLSSEKSLEEERRLMYVAMTRARKKLYISFSKIPSRFITEIPDEYLELKNDFKKDNGEFSYSKDDYYDNEYFNDMY